MSQDFKITSRRNKITVRYQYVIFPFGTEELLNNLARTNSGYVLAPPPKTPVGRPMGATLDWSGTIGKKGNVLLSFDSISQIIGVDGTQIEECVNVFSEVLDIIKTTMEPEFDNHAIFYESVSNFSIETGNNPLQVIGKIKPEGKTYDVLSKIFQESIATYSLHLFSPDKKIESTDWFDFKIQPVTLKSEKVYDVMVVNRNKDKSNVDKFLSNLEESIRNVFVEIEK